MQTCLMVLVLLAAPSLALAAATAREAVLEIPTYPLGPDDPNPPVFNANVYPYPMQTRITDSKSIQKHRAVILENDYIRVIILPDLGGRIYAAHDKTNGDFDFIYHNHVIKPALVALRGAWLSGGIEWNFPTRGHTVNTVAPVKYKIVSDPGSGTVTCIVGTTEWVRRMRWSVGVSLRPDESRFSYTVRLVNPTLTHNNAYFWANAAVHAWDETRVTFPPAQYTFAGGRMNPRPWPIVDGKDVSWYRNTPIPYDYFCGTTGDFQGAYNHQRDNGTVCSADRYESMGRKFWTWGTAPSGQIWEKILSDGDGQYIEVQTGRLPTQGDTWVFEPHRVETWSECWYPIRRMGGLVKANRDVAVNFAMQDGGLVLAVNASRAIQGAAVQLMDKGKVIFEEKVDLPIAGSWRTTLPQPASDDLQLVLKGADGAEIIRYSTRADQKIPPPQLEPKFPADDECSAEQLYLKGYYAQKHWDPEGAVEYFRKALKLDDGFTPALRAMAIHFYKTGRYEEARQYAARVLLRNDDDDLARYYLALAKMKLDVDERTEEDLELIGRRSAWRHLSPYLRACLAAKRGDLARAEQFLARLSSEEEGGRGEIFRAAIARRVNRADEARKVVDGALAKDALDPLALIEKALQGSTDDLDLLRDDPQEYIEASCAYGEMNLWEDAGRALELCLTRGPANKHPFIFFHLGYLADRQKQPERARACFEQGIALSPDYVFPFRTEDLDVLRAGLRYWPNEWKLHYYMGVLLASSMRWEEGLKELEAAAESNPKFAPLYACVGEIYRQKVRDEAKARESYERAMALNPADANYYVALDTLYAARGMDAQRQKMFENAPEKAARDYRVLLRKSIWLVDTGQLDQAIQILRQTHFHPWEGWSGAHEVYVRALRARAEQFMQSRQFARAIEDLKAAMEYPENLGSGRPHNARFPYEHCNLGLCYLGLKQPETALKEFEAVGEGDSPWHRRAAEELAKLKP